MAKKETIKVKRSQSTERGFGLWLIFVITFFLFHCFLVHGQDDYLKMANDYFDAGDYDLAKRYYMAVEKQVGGDMSVQIKKAEDCYSSLLIANEYFNDKDYEKARDRYKRVLDQNPKDTNAKRKFDQCVTELTRSPVAAAEKPSEPVMPSMEVKKEFFGMWTLEIEDAPVGGSIGWLGVNDSKGFLDAELLWQGGSVMPASSLSFSDDRTLEVKLKYGRTEVRFIFERTGNNLTGTQISPSRDGMSVRKTKFKGWRLADPGPAPDLSKVKYGTPIKLFSGKDLTGWRLTDPNQTNGFKVVNGELVNNPVYPVGQRISFGNLRTDYDYDDFKLMLEVNIPAGSNSGIWLRGMYEIQVADSYGKPLDPHNMGALYSRITPSVAAEKPAGEWQTMEMILYRRHLTVVLNGRKIIDNKPVYGPTGGAIQADVLKSGPIVLQGDHGKVSFRNIVLTPIINN